LSYLIVLNIFLFVGYGDFILAKFGIVETLFYVSISILFVLLLPPLNDFAKPDFDLCSSYSDSFLITYSGEDAIFL
jgi:hypothetical protein